MLVCLSYGRALASLWGEVRREEDLGFLCSNAWGLS